MYPTLPGATADTWTLSRTPAGTDAEGNPAKAGKPVQVASGSGAFGWASVREQAIAARAEAVVDGHLTTSAPSSTFEPGDLLTVRGTTFRVVKAKPGRLHTRVTLAHLGRA